MKKSILAFILGLLVWAVVVTLINRGLRIGIPGYVAAERSLDFTLGMKIGRLLMAALASLAAGAVAGKMTGSTTRVAWILGAVLLAVFVPVHVQLWAKFPVWYHLTFLLTLAPLVALGATLTRNPCIASSRMSESKALN